MSSPAQNVLRPAFARMADGPDLSANEVEGEGGTGRHVAGYVKKRPVLVKLLLTSGQECIGFCHVEWPEGRVSDLINDDRKFLPLTRVSIAGHHLTYDFLTVNKSLVAMVYEMDRN